MLGEFSYPAPVSDLPQSQATRLTFLDIFFCHSNVDHQVLPPLNHTHHGLTASPQPQSHRPLPAPALPLPPAPTAQPLPPASTPQKLDGRATTTHVGTSPPPDLVPALGNQHRRPRRLFPRRISRFVGRRRHPQRRRRGFVDQKAETRREAAPRASAERPARVCGEESGECAWE